MRRLAAAALGLSLAGCGPALPPGFQTLGADAENRDFAWDPAHSRLIYLSGAYPRKSFLCVQPLPEGPASRIRVLGHSFVGAPSPLRDGAAAFAPAATLGKSDAPNSMPPDRVLLRVDLRTGAVRRDYELPSGAVVLASGDPPWAPAPLVAFGDRAGRLKVAAAGLLAGLEPAASPGPALRAEAAAFPPDEPALAATFWSKEGGALALFDLRDHKLIRAFPIGLPGEVLLPLGGGRWLASHALGAQTHVLEAFDSATGQRREVLRVPGSVETAAAGARWLFAVSRSVSRPRQARRAWLRPRDLHRIDLAGVQKPWSSAWTQRPGRLLGLDEKAGRLYFAVEDKDASAAWILPQDPGSLALAAAVIDASGSAGGSLRLGLAAFAAMVGGMFVIALARMSRRR